MATAERNCELVTHFQSEGSGLGKPQVMRVGRLTSADQTGLRSDKFQMGNGRAKGAARLRARSMTLRFGHLPALGGPVLYKSISSACGALVMICSRGCKARMVTK